MNSSLFAFKVVEKVAADVAALGMIYEPGFEIGYFLKIGGADAVAKGLDQLLLVFGAADFPLVGGGENVVQLGVQAFALERLPFPLVQPDAAGDGADIDVKIEAVADLVADEEAAGFRADEGAARGIIGR